MRCPHCGEPAAAGQERCFACGEKLRSRRLRQKEQPVNLRIIILGGLLLIFAIVGLLGTLLGTRKKTAAVHQPVRSRLTSQVQDSLARVRGVDTAKTKMSEDALSRMQERVEKLKQRYEKVKSQVVKETPSSEQRDLIHQIQREFGLMNSLVAELSSGVNASRKKQIQADIAKAERRLNSLISQLTRAPKSR